MQKFKWRALEALGLSGDAVLGELRIAALSNRSVSVAGVQAVKRYAPDSLRMQVIGGVVQVDGFELMLCTISTGIVEVCGRIDTIAFEMDAAEEKS